MFLRKSGVTVEVTSPSDISRYKDAGWKEVETEQVNKGSKKGSGKQKTDEAVETEGKAEDNGTKGN